MKRIVGWIVAAGICLGLTGMATAAPVSAGAARMTEAAADGGRALVAEVGYRRGHHRGYHHRAYHGRPVYRHRVVYHHRHFARPVYYRPVRHRPVYAAPAYYGGYGYGPRCYIKIRKVYTWQGLVRKPVRICRY
jgi:hypothetical protein